MKHGTNRLYPSILGMTVFQNRRPEGWQACYTRVVDRPSHRMPPMGALRKTLLQRLVSDVAKAHFSTPLHFPSYFSSYSIRRASSGGEVPRNASFENASCSTHRDPVSFLHTYRNKQLIWCTEPQSSASREEVDERDPSKESATSCRKVQGAQWRAVGPLLPYRGQKREARSR